MFDNPFATKTSGTIILPELAKEALISTSPLELAAESDFSFELPSFEITSERLKQIVPPFDESDETAWTLHNLIREDLQPYLGGVHSVEDLRDRITTISGTALLASEDFIDSPHDLLQVFAERYAKMGLIAIDKSILRALMGDTAKFKFASDMSSLSITTQDLKIG